MVPVYGTHTYTEQHDFRGTTCRSNDDRHDEGKMLGFTCQNIQTGKLWVGDRSVYTRIDKHNNKSFRNSAITMSKQLSGLDGKMVEYIVYELHASEIHLFQPLVYLETSRLSQ